MDQIHSSSSNLPQDKSGPVVPVRHFGRGRRDPSFGHGRTTFDNNYTATLLLVFGFGLFAPWVDWEWVYENYGFYIPGFYDLITRDYVGNFLQCKCLATLHTF